MRGIGHFWALELVKNRRTREPFNVKVDKFGGTPIMANLVAAEAMKNGVYVAAWYDTLVIAPPLIISEQEVDEALEVIDKALQLADRDAVVTDLPVSRSSDYAREQ